MTFDLPQFYHDFEKSEQNDGNGGQINPVFGQGNPVSGRVNRVSGRVSS
jgi:hypothetical protein